MTTRIGVLALQGAFAEHVAALRAVGAEPVEIRLPAQLDEVEGLVIPGGESTTMRPSASLAITSTSGPTRSMMGARMNTA